MSKVKAAACAGMEARARGAPVARVSRAAQIPVAPSGPRRGTWRSRCWRYRETMGYPASPVSIRTSTPLLVAGLALAFLLTFPLAIGKADESHLLYGAKRILGGEVIYRDFFEII